MSLKKLKIGLLVLLLLSFGLPIEAGYRSTLNHSTKSKQWFSTENFHANIIWHATYYSPKFRRAHEKRDIQKKYLDPIEAARYIAEQEKQQATYDEFFIDLYARKPYEQLTLGKDSFWELVLQTKSGELIKPLSIEFVEITPYEEVMFPYLTRWSKGYRVLFPKTDLGRSFKLILRSVIGKSELKW